MTKEIPLTKGKVALVDDEDFARVNQFKWHAICPKNRAWYAAHSSRDESNWKKRHIIYLHRFLMNPAKGQVIDHINGNGLDCRRSNMRICSIQENNRNSRPRRTSQLKGLFFDKRTKTWRARIKDNGTSIFIGTFVTEKDAALAYNAKAKELFGEFARLNEVK